MNRFSFARRGAVPPESLAPRRYTDGGGTAYEQRLLASARRDASPAASEAHWAAVLEGARAARHGVVRGSAAATTPPTLGSIASMSGRKPWVAGLVGLSIIGAWVASRSSSDPVAVEARPPVADVAPPEPARSPPPEASAEPADVPAREARASEGRRAPRQPAASPRQSSTPPAPPVPAADLAGEVRAIESIQTLLAWGQAKQAAGALSRYRRRYPHGELALEADLLDVDIAIANGDRARGATLARALLERPGASRYRARLSGLLDARARERDVGSNGAAARIKERR
jgi:hypothetical protein